ncbi:MAG: cytochrome c3 family protein [Candidatus Aminicenantes bacterium]
MTRVKNIDGFLILLLILFFIPLSLFSQSSSCITCHQQMEDELFQPVKAFDQDIHQQVGLSCVDCHGGDPGEEDIDSAKDATFKGKPERIQIPEFCASCHSDPDYMKRFDPDIRVDQLALYWTSHHGQLLKKGGRKAAVCTDCHGVHGIQKASHPQSWTFPWNIPKTCGGCHSDKEYMKDYSISTSQQQDYMESVHAQALLEKKDLSAPVCNDCHGNHGAVPPEVTFVAQVCRQCHLSAGELFSASPHKQAFKEMGFSECGACHQHHKIVKPSDEMLGYGGDGVCLQCHDEDSEAYQMADEIRQKITRMSQRIETAGGILNRAYKQGVEVSDPRFRLKEAESSLVKARNLTHSLSLESVEKEVSKGEQVVSEVIKEGEAALREARVRKTGLVIALLFVFLLAVGLFLKIRHLKTRGRAS